MPAESARTDAGRRSSHFSARFDDLSPGGESFELQELVQTITAQTPNDVRHVFDAVESATEAGHFAAGYVSYGAATAFDPHLRARCPRVGEPFFDLPLAAFGIFKTRVSVPSLTPRSSEQTSYELSAFASEISPDAYASLVGLVRDEIKAGETYQCNLTVRLRGSARGDLAELYRDLILSQRGQFGAFIDTGRFAVLSASPELFFERRGGLITTRPMKGTAARVPRPLADALVGAELRASPKETAENLMIVDLLRNDLGRIATYGSVQVARLFELERYETLHQLTSTVCAQTRTRSLFEVFSALFPCGSVTGAPKKRTMELIAAFEPSARNLYCGAIGFVAPQSAPTTSRFSVAIRTLVIDKTSAEAEYGSGGAITWDSTARAEHNELWVKAAILGKQPEQFGLIETMAFLPRLGIRNQEAHLRRLRSSATYFDIPYNDKQIRTALQSATRALSTPTRIRLVCDAVGRPMVETEPLLKMVRGPLLIDLDEDPVQSSDIRLYHKTTMRSIFELRRAKHPEVDDVLLKNERGELTESTTANLVMKLHGRWYTPPIEVGCLAGIGRARLITNGQLEERTLFLDDLERADAIALVSSLRGWRAATLRNTTSHRRSSVQP